MAFPSNMQKSRALPGFFIRAWADITMAILTAKTQRRKDAKAAKNIIINQTPYPRSRNQSMETNHQAYLCVLCVFAVRQTFRDD
jgi:hypothetical protein